MNQEADKWQQKVETVLWFTRVPTFFSAAEISSTESVGTSNYNQVITVLHLVFKIDGYPEGGLYLHFLPKDVKGGLAKTGVGEFFFLILASVILQ